MYLHLLCTLAPREAAKYTASTQRHGALEQLGGWPEEFLKHWDVRHGLGGEVHAFEKPCRHLLLEENALNRVPHQGPKLSSQLYTGGALLPPSRGPSVSF